MRAEMERRRIYAQQQIQAQGGAPGSEALKQIIQRNMVAARQRQPGAGNRFDPRDPMGMAAHTALQNAHVAAGQRRAVNVPKLKKNGTPRKKAVKRKRDDVVEGEAKTEDVAVAEASKEAVAVKEAVAQDVVKATEDVVMEEADTPIETPEIVATPKEESEAEEDEIDDDSDAVVEDNLIDEEDEEEAEGDEEAEIVTPATSGSEFSG